MQLLTVKNAAATIQASQHTIYRAINAGQLRFIDIGGGPAGKPRIRIDMADLRAWVDSRASKPQERAS